MSVSFNLDLPWTTVNGKCEFCDGSGVDFNAPDEFRPRARWDNDPRSGSLFTPGSVLDEHKCSMCEGLGKRDERAPEGESHNFANATARAALSAFGISDLEGQLSQEEIPGALQRFMISRNADSAFADFEIPAEEIEPGSAGTRVVDVDGIPTVQSFGARVINFGLSSDVIEDRAGIIAGLMIQAMQRNCGICWG